MSLSDRYGINGNRPIYQAPAFFSETPFGRIRRVGSVRGENFLGQKINFFSPWQEISIFCREIGTIWREFVHFGKTRLALVRKNVE